ncbi:hypothetical protein Nepgr_018274 [Nepenthes gracilis]|uniref:Uncharacterized protein n=1 Tax=Nepenthes gracilis TaxID=150966 RepID=A0AAD3SRY9_NEPGR|nr:hypothetical protein Nepgr_018274 [Nepenthes gracilis]
MAKSVKCHSIVTSIHKVKPLQRLSWRTNLMSILSPLKQQQQRDRASLGSLAHSTKGGMELSDDMSLKKHLLHLKAKIREKKSLGSGMRCRGQEAEVRMEQVFQIEAKLRNLEQILLKLQPVRTDQPDEPNVVYIPIAELKEKVCR